MKDKIKSIEVDKRNITLRFRVNQKENELINDRVEGDFSSWIRNLALGSKKEKGRNISLADPDLLFELNKIGVNLNQIAKGIHLSGGADIDKVKLLLRLASIDEELKKIREDYAR